MAVAWDPTRPVPWKRLVVPFAVYAVIAVGAFSFFGKSNAARASSSACAMGGVLYLGITVMMVKFGWNPPAWGGAARADQAAAPRRPRPAKASSAPAHRRRPGPSPPPPARTNAGNPRAKRGR